MHCREPRPQIREGDPGRNLATPHCGKPEQRTDVAEIGTHGVLAAVPLITQMHLECAEGLAEVPGQLARQ